MHGDILEPMVGIEPTTFTLRKYCSTTELHRLQVPTVGAELHRRSAAE